MAADDDVPPELSALHQALLHAEGSLEPRMTRLRERLGLHHPRTLVAYRSFGSPTGLRVRGRLLADTGPAASTPTDRWWHHLGQTYRRWNTRELPGVEVTLRHADDEVVVTTDDEGDYTARLPAGPVPDTLTWREIEATVASPIGPVVARHRVLVPGADARCLVLSDVDDTVLHTGATSALRMAWHSFAKSARYRRPLPGIRALYQALAHGPEGDRPRNPLGFVSSSPRNLYDLLSDFLALNEVPEAPLLLRDVGLDTTKIVKSRGHGHKLERIEEVMALYPDLPVILLGDTGQHDAQLYAEAVQRHGERVLAVYLRDVDPDRDTPRDQAADAHGAHIEEAGVPYVRGGSEDFASHALERGWIGATQRDAVVDEARRGDEG